MSNTDFCSCRINLKSLKIVTPNDVVKGTMKLSVYKDFIVDRLEAQIRGVCFTRVATSSEDDTTEAHEILSQKQLLLSKTSVQKGFHTYNFKLSFPGYEMNCYHKKNNYLPTSFSFTKLTCNHGVYVNYYVDCFLAITTPSNANRSYSSRDSEPLIFLNTEIARSLSGPREEVQFCEKQSFIEKKVINDGAPPDYEKSTSKGGFFKKIFQKNNEEAHEVKHVLFTVAAKTKTQYFEFGGSLEGMKLYVVSTVGPERYSNPDGSSTGYGMIYVDSIKVSLKTTMNFTASSDKGDYKTETQLTGNAFKSGFIDLANLKLVNDPISDKADHNQLTIPTSIFDSTKLKPIPEEGFPPTLDLCNYQNKYQLIVKIKFKGKNTRSSKSQTAEIILNPVIYNKGVVSRRLTKQEEADIEAKRNRDANEDLPTYVP